MPATKDRITSTFKAPFAGKYIKKPRKAALHLTFFFHGGRKNQFVSTNLLAKDYEHFDQIFFRPRNPSIRGGGGPVR